MAPAIARACRACDGAENQSMHMLEAAGALRSTARAVTGVKIAWDDV